MVSYDTTQDGLTFCKVSLLLLFSLIFLSTSSWAAVYVVDLLLVFFPFVLFLLLLLLLLFPKSQTVFKKPASNQNLMIKLFQPKQNATFL